MSVIKYYIEDSNTKKCYKDNQLFFQTDNIELAKLILDNEISKDEWDREVDLILNSIPLSESLNLFEEQLYEMASVRSKSIPNGLLLSVNPDQNRLGEAYFKLYDNTNYNKARKVARISFFEPRLISHRCTDKGKLPWTDLHSYNIKHLNDLLDSESRTFPGFTVWDELKYFWNSEYPFDMSTPLEYFNGVYDNIYESHPSYVSSKLEPPNYMNIVKIS